MLRCLLTLALLTSFLASAQDLHLKTGNRTADSPTFRSSKAGRRHQIIQFDHTPDPEDIETLMEAGIVVLAAIPDNGLMVNGPAGTAGVGTWRGELQVEDKLSPELSLASETLAVIEFHTDVATDTQEAIAAAEGLTVLRPLVLLPSHLIVNAAPGELAAMATHDEVAYIFPADPALLADPSLIPCAGMLTLSGPIAQYANIVHGWDLDPGGAVRLNYVFGALTPRIPDTLTQSEIVRAMNEWSRITNVNFQAGGNASAARTIAIKFASGAHGDPYPFDPAGSALAHTFFPVPVNAEPVAGDVHLNANETWNAGGDVDVYTVALHELGHALGLGHSDKAGDVMYPYYRRGMQLSAGDIGAVQALYGASPSAPTALPPINLSLDPVTSPGQAAAINLTGALSGGVAPVTLQWQTDQGFGGTINPSAAWTATGITLASGLNTVTVTALDSARQAATRTVTITRQQQPAADFKPPAAPLSLGITSPASSTLTTSNPSITVAGKASSGNGISQVIWQTAAGASGIATGTGPWVAPNIPLLIGTNTILIRALDAKGASGWATLVVVRH